MNRFAQVLLAITFAFVASTVSYGAGYKPSQMSSTWTSFVPDNEDRAFVYGVSAIVEHDESLWIGTENHGLWRYRDGVFEDLSSHLHARHVRAILKGNDDSLWFCYDKWGGHGSGDPNDKEGVARYRKGEWQQYDMPDLIPGFAISLNKVFKTKDSALWFITMGRLIKFKDGKWTLIPNIVGPNHFLEAADGTVWVTGEGGEHIWKSNKEDQFLPVAGGNGVSFQYPNSLVQAASGTIWIGDYGLTTYENGKFGRIEAKPTFDDNRIWPQFASNDGTLYVTKSFGGLFPYRDGKWIVGENTDWKFSGPVLETHDGKIWYGLGGREQGLANFDGANWYRFVDIAPNVVPNVESLHEGSDGTIWAGIKTGYIARYSMGEWRVIPRKPPNTMNELSESVTTWCNVSDDSLWVGMKNGELRRFASSKANLRLRKENNVASLALTINRGHKDATKWSVKYGFSASAKTPPSEFFQAQFGASGEIPLALPISSQKSYLHAFAVDVDGTTVELSDESRIGAIVASEGLNDVVDIPVPEGLILNIDGLAITDERVQFRGATENFLQSAYQNLSDGFHEAQLKVQSEKLRLIIYKEKQKLKIFRPFKRSLAIIIAISNYPNSSGYRALPQAETQARKLENYLRQQDFEIVSLPGPRATRSNIIDAITKAKVGPDDRLLIYFGGHGDARNVMQDYIGYIVPFDVEKSNIEKTGIALSDIIEKFTKSLQARQVMYVFDSCQSGFAIKRGEIDKNALRQVKAYEDIKYYAQRGRMILTAGAKGEAAIDVNGGIFTQAFLNGIQGHADREVGDNNGIVDFYELFAYVHREVTNAASNRGFLQHPDFSTSGGVGRFYFVTDRSLLPSPQRK